jgi:AbrB family looped-hinge helix DNA binding protein
MDTDTVIVSPAFQVRLPKRVREALGLVPGQRLRVVQYGQRVELVPLRPVLEAPGLFGDHLVRQVTD